MKNKIIKEVCVDNFVNVEMAIYHKAERIEICSNLSKGGLSPDLDLCQILLKHKMNVVVMLRTNDGFHITKEELVNLKISVQAYIDIGVTDFIFGWVNNNTIDIESCQEIISCFQNKETYSFHMAIDEMPNYDRNIKTLINLGFKRVLTKGGTGSAIENLENLEKLVSLYDDKITIVIGGKVTKNNWEEIREATGASQFHGTKLYWS